MSDLVTLTFSELTDRLDSGKNSCVELAKECLARIKKYDPVLKAFLSLRDEKEVLALAKESDKRRKAGKKLSPIDGIPVALKDNILAIGLEATSGSRILEKYKAPYNATVSSKLESAGAIIIGKTNCDEFAMGSTTENSAWQQTRNPWDTNRVPGGSSGGSAVAVASGMVPLALGSDTGGSIRQPAAFCGVAGMKPTYGLVSRYGLMSYGSSLDQIGPFARDVAGVAALLDVIKGYDTMDSTSIDKQIDDLAKYSETKLKGLKVAVFPEFMQEGVDPDVYAGFQRGLETLKDLGATVDEVPFPYIKYAIPTYYFIACAEAASNLSRYDGLKYGRRSKKQTSYEEMLFSSRSEGFGKEVKKRILLGNFVLSSGYYDEYYRKAQKLRTFIIEELRQVFQRYDVVATPTAPDIAFPIGQGETDPLKIYLSDITTVLANLCGLPGISVPLGLEKSMPTGIQFIGQPLSETSLLGLAAAFEEKTGFNKVPDLDDNGSHGTSSDDRSNAVESNDDTAAVFFNRETIKKVSDTYRQNSNGPVSRVLCTDLESSLGKKVTIQGWVHRINKLGGVEFYIIRDRSGMTQIVLEGSSDFPKLVNEMVIAITGTVTKEERSAFNNIEIKAESIEVLGVSKGDVPINISSIGNTTLPTILDHRPLSVRNPRIRRVFTIQAEMVNLFGEFLRNNAFTEIKTPKIISSGTEGGTNIFELKYFDKVAFLAQSPQFYKQIMVGSGFERVFEIGPVFRAEKHDTIRHINEYISLDFEMGFIRNEQDIIDMQERCIQYMLKGLIEKHGDILEEFEADMTVPKAIPRIHFIEALEICAEQGVTNMDGDISPEGEVVLCDYFKKKEGTGFVYIVGYPVKKRPMYTMPDERLPGYTRSFDLIYNGLEITTGGQRINEYDQLRENIIQFGGNPRTFDSYLSIFKYGMPPHGGLGMGLERFTMKLLNLSNVRESTLFPRDIGRLTP
jgi:aspartyl-tRNA(Asn)/glutamyl-tRNA(Gln) amidotransferase subunit A